MNVHLQNIVEDAIYILEKRARDRRRAEPFQRLVEQVEVTAQQVRAALERSAKGLRAAGNAAAEEIDELIVRIDKLR